MIVRQNIQFSLDIIPTMFFLYSPNIQSQDVCEDMSFTPSIDRNREALRAILATLFALLGLASGGVIERVPRGLRLAVLRLLRPAEAAVRRLIAALAHGMAVAPSLHIAPAAKLAKGGDCRRIKCFALFDRRKALPKFGASPKARSGPFIRVIGIDPGPAARQSVTPPVPGAVLVDAVPICRRLHALQRALDDLPAQAKRMARWLAKRAAQERHGYRTPMRPGRPPGHRARGRDEMDEILRDCHLLALETREAPDTS